MTTLQKTLTESAERLGLLSRCMETEPRFEDAFSALVPKITALMNNADENVCIHAMEYFFFKGAEYGVGSDLYKERGAFDIVYSPDDIGQTTYKVNLPVHLRKELAGIRSQGAELAKEVFTLWLDSDDEAKKEILTYIQCLGDICAVQRKIRETKIKDYDNSQLMTVNEMRKAAGDIFLIQLQRQETRIFESDFGLDPYFHIAAQYNGMLHYMLVITELSPDDLIFAAQDMRILKTEADKAGAVPCLVALIAGSKNQKHFDDNVLLAGDEVKMQIHSFTQA